MYKGGDNVIELNFDNINEEIIYEVFQVDGREADALCDNYLELFEIIGRDAMLKLSILALSFLFASFFARSAINSGRYNLIGQSILSP